MFLPTTLTYMTHDSLYNDTATICELITLETGKLALILDKTIFYPQGGGQPYDQGTIEKEDHSALFCVDEVRFKDGIVYHMGTISSGIFKPGEIVTLHIDQKRRIFNSRNHSAGHIVDHAMHIVGMNLKPTKAYHFPTGAYIEYNGVLNENELTELQKNLQIEVDTLVSQTLPITTRMASLDEIKKEAKFVPDFLPENKPSKIMIVPGYPAIPCGGTHAHSTKEIGHITIEKVANKKGFVRVSYSIEPE